MNLIKQSKCTVDYNISCHCWMRQFELWIISYDHCCSNICNVHCCLTSPAVFRCSSSCRWRNVPCRADWRWEKSPQDVECSLLNTNRRFFFIAWSANLFFTLSFLMLSLWKLRWKGLFLAPLKVSGSEMHANISVNTSCFTLLAVQCKGLAPIYGTGRCWKVRRAVSIKGSFQSVCACINMFYESCQFLHGWSTRGTKHRPT